MSESEVQLEDCITCDGCGWYEGGPTIKTTCEKCNGTGKVPRVPYVIRSPLVPGNVEGDFDFGNLAGLLGMSWPDDYEGQRRCLISMAQTAAHWRIEVEKVRTKSYHKTEREKLYSHLQQRYEGVRKRLRNVRKAMKQYMVEKEAYLLEKEQELAVGQFQETQLSISQWAEKTFGKEGTNFRVATRANEEMSELLKCLAQDDNHSKAGEEIADVIIVLCRLAARLGVNIQLAIAAKMVLNRARKWELDGYGQGYHVSESEAEEPTL